MLVVYKKAVRVNRIDIKVHEGDDGIINQADEDVPQIPKVGEVGRIENILGILDCRDYFNSHKVTLRQD